MEALPATSHLPSSQSRSLAIAQSFASRANSVLRETAKLATTGVFLSIPAFFVFNPEVRNLLSTDTFITITGVFSGTVSFGFGTIFAKRQVQDFDQALADLFGHEPIFVRLNRYRYRNDIDRLKENSDYPVASIDIDMGSYREFLPEGFRWYYSGHVIPQDINNIIHKVTENL